MTKYLVAYGATAIIFFALDFIWLSTSLGLYRSQLGELLLEKPNLPIAAGFYLLYVVGIVALAITPALNGGGWANALWAGAILGLVAYGTYDITNMATVRNWSVTITIVDLIWGTTVTAVAATGGYLITRWLVP